MRHALTLLSLLGLSSAALADGATAVPQGGFSWQPLIMIVVIFAVFYFLFIMPQARKNKELRNLISNLNKGDEVLTTGGILGRVEKVADSYIDLALSDNVIIKIQKQAVVAMVPKGTLKSV